MNVKNIPYQSFCWALGTTSFRTAKLNLKIEQQLLLLSKFYRNFTKENEWIWNSDTQTRYYDFMKKNEFLTGDAIRKDKDAREKTSGLVDIGLINADRTITDAGYELLNITEKGDFKEDILFNIDKDSFVYFKQLLKTSIYVNNSVVRPYYVLVKVLTKLKYLSYEEFTYLLPLAISKDSTKAVISKIEELRKQQITVEDIIFEDLMSMSNYQLANDTFMDNEVSEELICLIGMNRKSRNYDKPYYELYKTIFDVFINNNHDKIHDLYLASKKINQKPGNLWRSLLFKTVSSSNIKKNKINSINPNCPFISCKTEDEIKDTFFKHMHVYKAMATLSDYFDLNRRYFNLTDTLIFEDQEVRFDTIPRYFFEDCIDKIYQDAYLESPYLKQAVSIEIISENLVFNEDRIYGKLSKDLGIVIKTAEQATTFINDERYRRFNQLIDKKFNDSVLLELLNCFEQRKDSRIEELVTDEADIPTIFEYVIGIIWYKASDKRGNILEYMKLSLEANLLPKTHAAGGYADIIYKYEACQEYPKHSLLIEATLSEGTNQRRMEMEPVSRHLGEYRLKYKNPFDYSLFISTYLHKNVIADFRGRKHMQYYGQENEYIEGMKIVSIDTKVLKDIIKRKINYKYLYGVFDRYYKSDLKLPEWQDNMIKEATQGYRANR